FEDAPQITVVVDLAVEDDPDIAGLVRHRLPPGLEIDDAQPAMPERGEVVDVIPFVIGSAVRQRGRHALDRAAPRLARSPARMVKASNAAHTRFDPARRC